MRTKFLIALAGLTTLAVLYPMRSPAPVTVGGGGMGGAGTSGVFTAQSPLAIVGTQVQLPDGSVNSNKFDAGTLALIGSGGGEISLSDATNAAQSVIALSNGNWVVALSGTATLTFTNRNGTNGELWISGGNPLMRVLDSRGTGREFGDYCNFDHGPTATDFERQMTAGSFAFGAGGGSLPGVSYNGYRCYQFQIGADYRTWLNLHLDHIPSAGNPQASAVPITWDLRQGFGGDGSINPGIAPVASTNLSGYIGFYNHFNATDLTSVSLDGDYVRGPLVGRMLISTNANRSGQGWDLRGKLIQESISDTPVATTVLDFNRAFALQLSGGVAAITFATTNELGGVTNWETREFLVRAEGLARTIIYPAWATNQNALAPTSIPVGQNLCLTLKSGGLGETNKHLWLAHLENDPTFYWDADALNYFNRAGSVSAVESNQVNKLVIGMKANGSWSKWDAYWLQRSGVSNTCAINLVSNRFYTVFGSGYTYATSGTTNTALTYADTTFKRSSTTRYNTNDACMFVYCATAAPTTTGGYFWGARGGGFTRFRLNASSTSVGLEVNSDFTAGAFQTGLSGNFTGLNLCNRTNSATVQYYLRGAFSASGAFASLACPTMNMYLWDEDNDGPNGHPMAATYTAAGIGAALTDAQIADLQTLLNAYSN